MNKKCKYCNQFFHPTTSRQYCCVSLECQRARRSDDTKKRFEKYKKEDYKRLQKYRKTYRYRLYGLDDLQIEVLYNKQDKKCKICKRDIFLSEDTLRSARTCIDHDHTTNVVRGLLCSGCNRFLGQHHDDSRIFKKAIQYLEDHL